MTPVETVLHATCVTTDKAGLLITGASGSGKSALALQLMGYGASLVADDRTIVTNREGILLASCPKPIQGMIEARGIGLLGVETQRNTTVKCVVDLDNIETDRLPPRRTITILGVEVELFFGKDNPNLAAALIQLMKAGRLE